MIKLAHCSNVHQMKAFDKISGVKSRRLAEVKGHNIQSEHARI